MNGCAQSKTVMMCTGSIEGEFLSIETQLEELGSLISELEGDLYQVLSTQPTQVCASGSAKPSNGTPMASRLSDLHEGLRNLSERVRTIRQRVDIW